MIYNRLSCNGVIVNVTVSCEVVRGFDPRLGQIIGYEISICCFSAKHATVRSLEQRQSGKCIPVERHVRRV
jgi:hypothetical protein